MTRRLIFPLLMALAILLTGGTGASAASQPISLKASSTSVVSGVKTTLTVSLATAAADGGAKIWIKSSDSKLAPAPKSLTVAAGKKSGTFSFTAGVVSEKSNVEIAVGGDSGEATISISIIPVQVKSVTLAAKSVSGGTTTRATVMLNAAAGADGAKVELWADGSAKVGSSITIKAGRKTATFNVRTSDVTESSKATVGAAFGGKKVTATLSIVPVQIASITVSSKTIIGGSTGTATVKLTGAASSDGIKMEVWVEGPGKTEGSLYIEPGKSSGTFTVWTDSVGESSKAVVGAAFRDKKLTAGFMIAPLQVKSIRLAAKSVISGGTVKATVELNGPAPEEGLKMEVWADSPGYTEGAVTFKGGKTSASFTVSTSEVSESTKITVGAAYNVKMTTSLTINPLAIESLSVASSKVAGGATVKGTVKLTGPASIDGARVEIWIEGEAKVEGGLYIEAGATSASFSIYTGNVSDTSTVTVGAAYNGTKLTTDFSLLPIQIKSISAPESVTSGGELKVTITLTVAAPEGKKFGLKTSDGNLIALPDAAKIEAGGTKISFALTAGAVKESTKVEIVAYDDTSSASTVIVINPAKS